MRIKTFLVIMVAAGVAILLQTAAPASANSPQAENKLKGVQYLRSETSPDLKLEEAIRKTMPDYNPANSDDEVHYFYNRVDLNGDGKMEVIAYPVGRGICGTGGCDTLIFQPAPGGYRLVSTIMLTNTPIIVSPRRTRGWNDLVIFVVGGGIQPGHYVTLRFNGRAYPDDPTALPKMRTRSGITGTAYIADDDLGPGKGIRLQPARR